MKPTRESILKDVADAVLKNRQAIYGPPENSFDTIADLWQTYLRGRATLRPDGGYAVPPLGAHDVAAMMMLLKVARIAVNPSHPDSWTDAAGYAVCGGELAPTPAQEEMDLQPCKTDARATSSSVTPDEAQELSDIAHKLLGTSVKQLNSFTRSLLTDAMLRPDTFTYEQYLYIKKLIP